MTRGGKRPGAGGKKPELPEEQKRVKVNFVVSPKTKAWIKAEADGRRIGTGRIIDELVSERIKNEHR